MCNYIGNSGLGCSKNPKNYDELSLNGGTVSKLDEVRRACEDRHPRLYSNLEQLLDQRQRLAKSIFTPSGTETEEVLQERMHLFENLQNTIRLYLAL